MLRAKHPPVNFPGCRRLKSRRMAIADLGVMQETIEGTKDTDRRPTHRRAHWWIGLATVCIISTVYLWVFIDRGWIPHDEGTLAQGAERVLAGELPHRDFIEGYTGGLTYLNALAFRVFGIHLLAIRYALLVAFVIWVPVYYYCATRMLSPMNGAAVSLLAVFWSVPNYPAAMPSWYNLFLATGGMAALLRYIESHRIPWVFLAGLLGGLSVLSKIHGLLFIAAGLLFLLYHESRNTAGAHERRSFVFQSFAGAILFAAVVSLLGIGLARGSWLDIYQFTIPGLAMVTIVGQAAFDGKGRSVGPSFIYLLGAVTPVIAFIIPYVTTGALYYLLQDVILVPTGSLEGASLTPPLPLGLIGLALTFFVAVQLPGKWKHLAIPQHAVALAVVALMLVPQIAVLFEPLIWSSLAESAPVGIAGLALLIARNVTPERHRITQSRSVLLGCVAAFCSLVQYPFAAHVYFSYSFPLLLLAIVAVVQEAPWFRRGAVQGLTCFFLLFGALYIAPMKLPGLLGPVARDDVALLDLPRAGLRVTRTDAENYPVAVRLVQAHAASGVIYAGPDAPEFYFLSGLKNPTRVFFDYQDSDTLFYHRLLGRLDSLGVNAIALRRRVVHSPQLNPQILDSLKIRFPESREVGRFTIRWR